MVEDNNNFANDIVIEDSENFYGGSGKGVDIKQICLMKFNKCLEEGSKEMSKGGIERKLVGNIWMDIEIPNQREIFINSVTMLQISVAYHLRKSKLKKEMEEIEDKIEEENKNDNVKMGNLGRENKRINNGSFGKRKVSDSAFTNQIDYHELKIIGLFRKKLEILSLLLKEINYFNEFDA